MLTITTISCTKNMVYIRTAATSSNSGDGTQSQQTSNGSHSEQVLVNQQLWNFVWIIIIIIIRDNAESLDKFTIMILHLIQLIVISKKKKKKKKIHLGQTLI